MGEGRRGGVDYPKLIDWLKLPCKLYFFVGCIRTKSGLVSLLLLLESLRQIHFRVAGCLMMLRHTHTLWKPRWYVFTQKISLLCYIFYLLLSITDVYVDQIDRERSIEKQARTVRNTPSLTVVGCACEPRNNYYAILKFSCVRFSRCVVCPCR